MFSFWSCLLGLALSARLAVPAPPAIEERLIERLSGRMLSREGTVSFQAPRQPEAPAAVPQALGFGDGLRTHTAARASVRFSDWSQLRMKELTRLEIVSRPTATNSPGLKLHEGQIYISSRGRGPQSIPIETPHVTGIPKGTEFLIAVDPQAARTEVTLFDGEVELSNGVETRAVRRGEQGIVTPGQPIEVRPLLQAQNIVQWWIYYPGVLDPDELGLAPDEQAELSASLQAYRGGDLQQALKDYPGYPTPPEPKTAARRVYYAGLLLAVGAVDRAQAQLARTDGNPPLVRALHTMMAAVGSAVRQLTNAIPRSALRSPHLATASELLALSYAYQSTNNLEDALRTARSAVERSPGFGFGWARVGELEFSFGRARAARRAMQRALELTPRNAQAHALQGFVLAAENRIKEALRSFDLAIAIDPGLGNAWLGRGLCKYRLGWIRRSRQLTQSSPNHSALPPPHSALHNALDDLQTAAILEPTRSLSRSYAGKAFGDLGDERLARKELDYARNLDENDPTPWLYSALLNRDANRVNEAVRDLEESIAKNDQRAVYRSRLLLDQDRAVRSANLAGIYDDAGMAEVSLREAGRAGSADYANYSAHLFLANSYAPFTDPREANLRYETVAFSEYLVGNLLAPVGATTLSPYVSQQEYSRLFERDGPGFSSSTEYRSSGDWRQQAAQYGTFGTFAYALDVAYFSQTGERPNNDFSLLGYGATVKQQLTSRDTLYVQTVFSDFTSGDLRQFYDPGEADQNLRVKEHQQPNLFAGLHHEWSPGAHTLGLFARLHDDYRLTTRDAGILTVHQTNGVNVQVIPQRFSLFDVDQQNELTAYSAELQQIWQNHNQVLIVGSRYQAGETETHSDTDYAGVLSNVSYPTNTQVNSTDLERLSVYGYYHWRGWDPLTVVAGLNYDHLRYPENIDQPPVSDRHKENDQLSPKAGFVWDLSARASLRGAYTRSLGGLYYDNSVRLEPTQIAGFNQAWRSLVPASVGGLAAGAEFETWGLELEKRFGRNTYLGIRGELLTSCAERTRGVYERELLPLTSPQDPVFGGTPESLEFREKSLLVTLNQLLGQEWAVGARYQLSVADWKTRLTGLDDGLLVPYANAVGHDEATLHQLRFFANFNHASGFFAEGQVVWHAQSNGGDSASLPGDEFWQFNLLGGYRFPRRQAEVTVGVLNLTGQDYHLNPLNLHAELPRQRTLLVSLRLNF